MTNHQHKISIIDQIRWFYGFYRNANRTKKYRVFLALDHDQNAVGYGALHLINDKLFITECVHSSFRGKGYGRKVLDHLIMIAKKEERTLVAEIWESNHISLSMHLRAGFTQVGTRMHNGQTLVELHHNP
jgi:L-amino acid N-acyltransferase YncA